ncbi:MAG: phosphatase PAP2 family protein [Phocaeicola sp.]
MDLNLFKRVESVKGLFAVESISLIYNAITTIMVFTLYSHMENPQLMLLERSGIALATFTLIYLYQIYPCKLTAFIRMTVQMAFLAYWYPDTFEFNRIFPNLDHLFATAEQYLFQSQPAVTFSQTFPSVWISEALNMGYFSYYPMIGVVAIYYFFFRFEWFEKASFVIVTSFFIYYFIYIIIPVAGPQFYFPAIGMDNVTAQNFIALGNYFSHNDILFPAPGYDHGFFYNLVEASQEVGERPTAAFPSSHVGITTILIIMTYRVNKILAYCMAPFYLLLCLATVYIQAHYAIDVLAGWISAVAIYLGATWMYKKWFASVDFQLVLE